MLTEAQAVDYIRTLFELEQEPGHPRAEITLGPATAFVLVGALQLALRHPEFSPSQSSMVNSIIDQLRPLFAGTPGADLLKLGDEPAFDIPRDCQYPAGPHSPACGPAPGDHAGFR